MRAGTLIAAEIDRLLAGDATVDPGPEPGPDLQARVADLLTRGPGQGDVPARAKLADLVRAAALARVSAFALDAAPSGDPADQDRGGPSWGAWREASALHEEAEEAWHALFVEVGELEDSDEVSCQRSLTEVVRPVLGSLGAGRDEAVTAPARRRRRVGSRRWRGPSVRFAKGTAMSREDERQVAVWDRQREERDHSICRWCEQAIARRDAWAPFEHLEPTNCPWPEVTNLWPAVPSDPERRSAGRAAPRREAGADRG